MSENQKNIISQKHANSLNRLNNPEDITVTTTKPEPTKPVSKPPTKAPAPAKSPEKYTTADWNKSLRGREFSDENTRYTILGIEFKRGADINNYVCDVVESKDFINGKTNIKKVDRPYYMLYHVLKEGKAHKEPWYLPDYDGAIRVLESR